MRLQIILIPAVILASGCWCCAFPEFHQKETTADADLRQLAVAAAAYARSKGKLPTQAEMTDCDAGCVIHHWPDDPWGRAYGLGRDGSSIWFESAGPDGEWGTADDRSSSLAGGPER